VNKKEEIKIIAESRRSKSTCSNIEGNKLICSNRRLQKWKRPRPLLLFVYLLTVAEQQQNYIVYNVAMVVQQYNYIATLPLPTTMGGVAFSISEVVYFTKKNNVKYMTITTSL
jgi:hypothetical protein